MSQAKIVRQEQGGIDGRSSREPVGQPNGGEADDASPTGGQRRKGDSEKLPASILKSVLLLFTGRPRDRPPA